MTAPYYQDELVTLYHGDCLEAVAAMADASVDAVITDPPYSENTHRQAKTTRGDGRAVKAITFDSITVEDLDLAFEQLGRVTRRWVVATLDYKHAFRFDWQAPDGLRMLRIGVWAKPNPMPESVTDRPTKAHEYVFLFAKSPRYYYDAEAIAEKSAASSLGKGGARFGGTKYGDDDSEQSRTKSGNAYVPAVRANKRTVWTVGTVPFPGAHFAVYPPELIRPCILAGSRRGDTVLDPFSGSGTTGMVAGYEGRKYVGIDLNAEYLDLSLRTRFATPTLGIEVVA